jgi:hypothetical protein
MGSIVGRDDHGARDGHDYRAVQEASRAHPRLA